MVSGYSSSDEALFRYSSDLESNEFDIDMLRFVMKKVEGGKSLGEKE